LGVTVIGAVATSLWLVGPAAASAAVVERSGRSASETSRVTVAAAKNVRAAPGAPTAGDSLFPDAGNSGYDVLHYRVGLTYHRSRGTITATTTIKAKAVKRLTSYTLDLEGLTVGAVTVNGHRARWSRSGHKLKVTPSRSVRGTFTTTIAYGGKPKTHIDPDGALDGWIPTADGATVLSEPVGAMTWFPNNNTPRDKATFDVAVNVPKDLEVAGSGDLASRKRHGSTTTWHWKQRRPMASYLAMISIAQYDVHRSTMRTVAGKKLPIWTFVDPSLGPLTAQRKLLPEIIRFEERRFGPYPQTSVGIVVKDTGAGYSLETQNRPVFDEVPDAGLMVHELAHQWFGDSLTAKDWGDIWLHEGFATYAESLWSAAHGGPSTAAQFSATMADNPASSKLWSPAPAALSDPADLFSDPVYTRGGLALEALRQKVGTRDFGVILKRWAAEHRGGGVRTSQFIALSERVSNRNLGAFFHAWLYVPSGPPARSARSGTP
jgi:aminopeptidase N